MSGPVLPSSVLTPEEIERFARHIVLKHIGGPGQQKLRAARVLVVGAGGLGSPLLLYLAAAGVGTLGIVDDDTVSLSNLQRQVLHGTPDLGRPKVARAAEALVRLDPNVHVEPYPIRLTAENAPDLIERYDVIADGSDNFATRRLLAQMCEQARKPLIHAAVNEFSGLLTTFKPYETGAGGEQNPRYCDLYPEEPPPGALPGCAQTGVLGALVGMLGSMQAIEVIRAIHPFGEALVGKLLLVDALDWRFETISYTRARPL